MTEYNIGQKVVIKEWDQLPSHLQNRAAVGGLCGSEAEIVDRLYSAAERSYCYKLRLTGAKTIPVRLIPAEALQPIGEKPRCSYVHELIYLDDVVVAVFYEVDAGGKKREIARGHGHIIHEGALGIAQAAGYALKKIRDEVEEGAS